MSCWIKLLPNEFDDILKPFKIRLYLQCPVGVEIAGNGLDLGESSLTNRVGYAQISSKLFLIKVNGICQVLFLCLVFWGKLLVSILKQFF